MVLGAIALPLLYRGHDGSRLSKDATQIRGIHQSWMVYAREFEGIMPTPGLIDRLPFNGVKKLGRGEEDITKNTTANIHALCVMQNYYAPELCVGPTEPNPIVKPYDWDTYYSASYAPAITQYWDPAFAADLQTGSNVSYANVPLCGDLRRKQWRASMDAAFPILGNRGPRDGLPDANSFTYRIHAPHDQWCGNICFNDNHIEFFTGLSSKPPTPGESFVAPGIFRYNGNKDADGIIGFTKAMTPTGPILQWD